MKLKKKSKKLLVCLAGLSLVASATTAAAVSLTNNTSTVATIDKVSDNGGDNVGSTYNVGGGGSMRGGWPGGDLQFQNPDYRYQETYWLNDVGGPSAYSTYITDWQVIQGDPNNHGGNSWYSFKSWWDNNYTKMFRWGKNYVYAGNGQYIRYNVLSYTKIQIQIAYEYYGNQWCWFNLDGFKSRRAMISSISNNGSYTLNSAGNTYASEASESDVANWIANQGFVSNLRSYGNNGSISVHVNWTNNTSGRVNCDVTVRNGRNANDSVSDSWVFRNVDFYGFKKQQQTKVNSGNVNGSEYSVNTVNEEQTAAVLADSSLIQNPWKGIQPTPNQVIVTNIRNRDSNGSLDCDVELTGNTACNADGLPQPSISYTNIHLSGFKITTAWNPTLVPDPTQVVTIDLNASGWKNPGLLKSMLTYTLLSNPANPAASPIKEDFVKQFILDNMNQFFVGLGSVAVGPEDLIITNSPAPVVNNTDGTLQFAFTLTKGATAGGAGGPITIPTVTFKLTGFTTDTNINTIAESASSASIKSAVPASEVTSTQLKSIFTINNALNSQVVPANYQIGCQDLDSLKANLLNGNYVDSSATPIGDIATVLGSDQGPYHGYPHSYITTKAIYQLVGDYNNMTFNVTNANDVEGSCHVEVTAPHCLVNQGGTNVIKAITQSFDLTGFKITKKGFAWANANVAGTDLKSVDPTSWTTNDALTYVQAHPDQFFKSGMPTGAGDVTVTKVSNANRVTGSIVVTVQVKNYVDAATGNLTAAPKTKDFTISGFQMLPAFVWNNNTTVQGKNLGAISVNDWNNERATDYVINNRSQFVTSGFNASNVKVTNVFGQNPVSGSLIITVTATNVYDKNGVLQTAMSQNFTITGFLPQKSDKTIVVNPNDPNLQGLIHKWYSDYNASSWNNAANNKKYLLQFKNGLAANFTKFVSNPELANTTVNTVSLKVSGNKATFTVVYNNVLPGPGQTPVQQAYNYVLDLIPAPNSGITSQSSNYDDLWWLWLLISLLGATILGIIIWKIISRRREQRF